MPASVEQEDLCVIWSMPTTEATPCGLQISLAAAAQATMPHCLPIQSGAAAMNRNPKLCITTASH